MTARGPSPRRAAVAIALAFATLLVIPSNVAHASGATPNERRVQLLRILNDVRARHHLPPFGLNSKLSRKAFTHSRSMARHYSLFHTPTLGSDVRRYDATVWAENIGYAKTLRQIVSLWMRSPMHRENLLNGRLSWAAIGVVRARGWLWVTEPMYG